jgi:hypothetical protein
VLDIGWEWVRWSWAGLNMVWVGPGLGTGSTDHELCSSWALARLGTCTLRVVYVLDQALAGLVMGWAGRLLGCARSGLGISSAGHWMGCS